MAELLSLCPNCKARLRVPPGSRNSPIDCPKCKAGFVPKDAPIGCPKCKTALPPGSVFCVGCGWDFRKKVKTTGAGVFVKAPKEKERKPEPDRFEKPEETLDVPTWKEILALPFDFELVVAEAVILTMWSFFWAGLFIAVAGGMIMALGAFGLGTIFAACMLLAGLIRLWMITSDISLQTVCGLLAGLIALASLVGWAYGQATGEDGAGVGLFSFMGFVLFGIWLRCVSFYFGRYFGIVRRSALRHTMSVSDRGGLVDLFHGVLLGLVGLSPLVLVWLADTVLAFQNEDFPGGEVVKWTLLAFAGAWSYFYMPMGVATVGLTGSTNPFKVLHWAFASFVDYFPLLVLYLPFHAVVWALSALIAQGVNGIMALNQGAGVMMAGLNFMVIQLLLNEYAITVTLASLGLMMRRHEESLNWAADAKRINAERD
jgi:hypothetical protein